MDNELVSFLRVVDKVPPQTAWLNKKHQEIFDNTLVEFKSANLISSGKQINHLVEEQNKTLLLLRENKKKKISHQFIRVKYNQWIYFLSLTASCQNAFASDEQIDFIINCAGETKSGQTDPVYKEGIYKLSLNCAQQAAKIGVKHYIELSAGNMNSSDKVNIKKINLK